MSFQPKSITIWRQFKQISKKFVLRNLELMFSYQVFLKRIQTIGIFSGVVAKTSRQYDINDWFSKDSSKWFKDPLAIQN